MQLPLPAKLAQGVVCRYITVTLPLHCRYIAVTRCGAPSAPRRRRPPRAPCATPPSCSRCVHSTSGSEQYTVCTQFATGTQHELAVSHQDRAWHCCCGSCVALCFMPPAPRSHRVRKLQVNCHGYIYIYIYTTRRRGANAPTQSWPGIPSALQHSFRDALSGLYTVAPRAMGIGFRVCLSKAAIEGARAVSFNGSV